MNMASGLTACREIRCYVHDGETCARGFMEPRECPARMLLDEGEHERALRENGRLRREHADAAAEVRRLEAELARLDEVYAERNSLAMLVAHLVDGFTTWEYSGVYEDPEQPGWPVVSVVLPEGEVTWHVPEALARASGLPVIERRWDGHTSLLREHRIAACCERLRSQGEVAGFASDTVQRTEEGQMTLTVAELAHLMALVDRMSAHIRALELGHAQAYGKALEGVLTGLGADTGKVMQAFGRQVATFIERGPPPATSETN